MNSFKPPDSEILMMGIVLHHALCMEKTIDLVQLQSQNSNNTVCFTGIDIKPYSFIFFYLRSEMFQMFFTSQHNKLTHSLQFFGVQWHGVFYSLSTTYVHVSLH